MGAVKKLAPLLFTIPIIVIGLAIAPFPTLAIIALVMAAVGIAITILNYAIF